MPRILKLCLLGLLFCSRPSWSKWSPIAVSLFPVDYLQAPFYGRHIYGLRSGLWGKHKSAYGIDFGIIGMESNEFVGLSFSGLFNRTKNARLVLLQFAGVLNYNKRETSMFGLQLAGIYNHNGEGTHVGLQVAGWMNNSIDQNVIGLQVAMANKANRMIGFQIGLQNVAQTVYGIQIGLVNETNSLHGIQIGVINLNHTGLLRNFPFIQVGF